MILLVRESCQSRRKASFPDVVSQETFGRFRTGGSAAFRPRRASLQQDSRSRPRLAIENRTPRKSYPIRYFAFTRLFGRAPAPRSVLNVVNNQQSSMGCSSSIELVSSMDWVKQDPRSNIGVRVDATTTTIRERWSVRIADVGIHLPLKYTVAGLFNGR